MAMHPKIIKQHLKFILQEQPYLMYLKFSVKIVKEFYKSQKFSVKFFILTIKYEFFFFLTELFFDFLSHCINN